MVMGRSVVYRTFDMCRLLFFFFSSRRRHTRFDCDWSSDVCSSDLELFPEHEPSKKVADPLFLGGTVDMNLVFALVETHGSRKDGAIPIAPDLFLAYETKAVDRIIESESDHARFFLGMVVWRPGQLDDELDRGLWFVDEPEAKLVLRRKTDGLWEELVRRLEAREHSI